MADGGVCSSTPLRVMYDARARVVGCGLEVCAIQLRYEFGGETELGDAAHALLAALEERYGRGNWREDESRPCPRVEGAEFGCVLDGVGIVDVRWRVADRGDEDACEQNSAGIALRAEGDAGTRDARVSITYFTREAAESFSSSAAAL